MYIAGIAGQGSFSGSLLYFAFDYTDAGMAGVTGFFTGNFFIGNLLLLPLFLLGLEQAFKRPGRIVPYLFALSCAQLIVFLAFVAGLASRAEAGAVYTFPYGLYVGATLSFVSGPFWMAYHGLMLRYTASESRGHEVAISELSLKTGAFAGSLLGGAALTFFPGIVFPVLCGVLLYMTSAALFVLLSRDRQEVSCKAGKLSHILGSALRRQAVLIVLTIVQGAANALTAFLAPVWMKIIGFGGLLTGSLMSLQILMRAAVSPLAGKWFHKGDGKEVQAGALVHMAGWIPWVLFTSPFLMVWSALCWTTGAHLHNTGLNSRWYDTLSLSGMALREISLGTGRLIAFFILAVVFSLFSQVVFFVFAAIVSFILYLLALLWLRRASSKETHNSYEGSAQKRNHEHD